MKVVLAFTFLCLLYLAMRNNEKYPLKQNVYVRIGAFIIFGVLFFTASGIALEYLIKCSTAIFIIILCIYLIIKFKNRRK